MDNSNINNNDNDDDSSSDDVEAEIQVIVQKELAKKRKEAAKKRIAKAKLSVKAIAKCQFRNRRSGKRTCDKKARKSGFCEHHAATRQVEGLTVDEKKALRAQVKETKLAKIRALEGAGHHNKKLQVPQSQQFLAQPSMLWPMQPMRPQQPAFPLEQVRPVQAPPQQVFPQEQMQRQQQTPQTPRAPPLSIPVLGMRDQEILDMIHEATGAQAMDEGVDDELERVENDGLSLINLNDGAH